MPADNVTAAKAIRTELRTLAKTDPRLSGAKVSVTAGSASLMSEVNVRVTNYNGGKTPSIADPAVRVMITTLYGQIARHWQSDGRHRFASVSINGISF